MSVSPEAIEAINPSEISQLKELAKTLHERTGAVLELLSPNDVGEEENLRTALCIKLDQATKELSRKMRNLRSVLKQTDTDLTKQISALKEESDSLSIWRAYINEDKGNLKSHRISIYVARKEGRA